MCEKSKFKVFYTSAEKEPKKNLHCLN